MLTLYSTFTSALQHFEIYITAFHVAEFLTVNLTLVEFVINFFFTLCRIFSEKFQFAVR